LNIDAKHGLVAVSAGDSPESKTRRLAHAGIDLHGNGELIDLIALDAAALLGRRSDAAVDAAVDAAAGADILLVATPVYRATYSGALKAFFDRFPTNGLATTAVVLAATAAIPQHFLALDTGMRAVIASLSGWTVPTVVYATGEDFIDGRPGDDVVACLRRGLGEAGLLVEAIRSGAISR
jgi:FMN reductase